jgi:hypothetical protein
LIKIGQFSGFFTCFVIAVFLYSCGGDTKQSQSNLNSAADEEIKFAKSLYGEKAAVLLKGDLLSNGKESAVTGIVKQKTDNSYWVEKASFVQKDADNWKVLLTIEQKLISPKGEIINQADAKNGYILSFDTTTKPVTINIVMADEYGKAASDEAQLVWNRDKQDFEFKLSEEISQ